MLRITKNFNYNKCFSPPFIASLHKEGREALDSPPTSVEKERFRHPLPKSNQGEFTLVGVVKEPDCNATGILVLFSVSVNYKIGFDCQTLHCESAPRPALLCGVRVIRPVRGKTHATGVQEGQRSKKKPLVFTIIQEVKSNQG